MKKVFLLKYLLLYSTLANYHQGPPTAKKISPPSPNTSNLPIFTWTSPTSLHVTYPDNEEDIINLHPSDTGGFPVKCLYDGTFSKEVTASAVVSGCLGNSSTYITVYTSHLQGTVFTVRDNVTTEERDPYANGGVDYFEENPLEDREAARVKRSEFYYYSGEDEYVDLDFDDGSLEPTPPNLLLLYKLAFDETLKAHFGGDEDAARAYTIEVATHASVHMKHSSLGVKIHMLRVEDPKFAQGLTLTLSSKPDARKNLAKVQNIKETEPVPLIAFCKTDDLSRTLMGVSWPGRRGGACNDTKGSAVVKWRSNIALAGVTLAHESGHLTGQLEDKDEDKINKRKHLFDPQNPCEGRGIMSSGSRGDRPKKWSICSQERLIKWFPIHGQCLEAPNCMDDLDWTTPCFCGSAMCLSQHIYCLRRSSNEAHFKCLTRMDLRHKLQTCGSGLTKVTAHIKDRYMWGGGGGTVNWVAIELYEEEQDSGSDMYLSAGQQYRKADSSCTTAYLTDSGDSWSAGNTEEYTTELHDFGDCDTFLPHGAQIRFKMIVTNLFSPYVFTSICLNKMKFIVQGEKYVWEATDNDSDNCWATNSGGPTNIATRID